MVGVVAQAQANLGRVAVALARAVRVEEDQEMTMVHGLTALTQDGQHQRTMMAGLVAPALASQARAEADQALGRAVRAEDQVTMMDHGVLDLMMVGLQALTTENGKVLALVLENQARAEVDRALVGQAQESQASPEAVDLMTKAGKMMVGKPALAQAQVNLGRAEVDQARQNRTRTKMAVEETVLVRLNQN